MIIVLDTNVIHSDFLMESGKFEILFDYVQKSQSKFVMPKVVYDELAATYERRLRDRLEKFLRAKDSLTAGLMQTQLPYVELSTESEVSSYLNYLKNRLSVKDEEFFDYKEAYLHDVMDRAIRRKRPCTDRGEEIRDAVLWRSVLDIAKEAPKKTVVFISENTKQFALGEGTLHPDLLKDCSEHGVTVEYFTSLDDFVEQHASIIDFINGDWLLASLDINRVLAEASEPIAVYAEYSLDRKLSDSFHRYDEERSSTGYFNPCGYGSLDVKKLYVYEMSDGSLRVEATLIAEVEVECEIEKVVRTEEYDHELECDSAFGKFGYTPLIGHRREVKSEYIYVYPEVSLNLEAIVRDKAVVSWKVINVESL
ncbi:MAG: PIN domain-containing protein [Halobacteriota archaeon]